jgi:protein tyrosine phosphatase (PTP) superfamily phosphohydrolase (DUF442 family)
MPGAPPFDWIAPGLALGGCVDGHPPEALAAYGVGAVIDLRAEACDDPAALEACGLKFLHLPTPDLQPVPPAMLEAGVAFAEQMEAQDRALLIHCQHGIGRSALLALCVMVDRGWAPAEALSQAKQVRAQLSPSPSQYRAWASWLLAWKARHGASWAIPDFDAFAAIAYRHLARA